MTTVLRKPIPFGTDIAPWGTVEAVGMTGGERYYWLVHRSGTVAMLPASEVERRYVERVTP